MKYTKITSSSTYPPVDIADAYSGLFTLCSAVKIWSESLHSIYALHRSYT